MNATWVAVIVTGVIQLLSVVYIVGRFSAKFEQVEDWIDKEAKPWILDHERRISKLEPREREHGRA